MGADKEMSFAHLRNVRPTKAFTFQPDTDMIEQNTNSRWWKDPCLRLNVFHCTGLYWCVFYLGYDASLLNGLQAMGKRIYR